MSLSIQRVLAIFMKDYKEFMRNMAISSVMFMTPLLALLYGRSGDNTIDNYFLLFNMTFAVVATYVQSSLIAEEKEKDTLRALMLSPATIREILLGKSLLTFLVTAITLALCMMLSDYTSVNMGIIILAFIISAIFYISLGTLIGLFTNTVMEASVYSFPVIGIFSMGSFIRMISEQYPILKMFHYLPNIQLIDIATKVEAGANLSGVLPEFIIISLWAVMITWITAFMYKKRMVD